MKQQSFAERGVASTTAAVLTRCPFDRVATLSARPGRGPRRALRFPSGAVDTLHIADVAARGTDVEETSLVINLHPPGRHGSHDHRGAGRRRAAA
jgi:hypothetical protein